VNGAASALVDQLEAWATEVDATPLRVDMLPTGTVSGTFVASAGVTLSGTANVSKGILQRIQDSQDALDDIAIPDAHDVVHFLGLDRPSPHYPEEEQWGIARYTIPGVGLDLGVEGLLTRGAISSSEQELIFLEANADEAVVAAPTPVSNIPPGFRPYLRAPMQRAVRAAGRGLLPPLKLGDAGQVGHLPQYTNQAIVNYARDIGMSKQNLRDFINELDSQGVPLRKDWFFLQGSSSNASRLMDLPQDLATEAKSAMDEFMSSQ
jgi:hypothetical protein